MRSARPIVLGLLVMGAALTLHNLVLSWIQFIAGFALFCLGVWNAWQSSKNPTVTDPVAREVIQRCIDTKKPVVAKRYEDGKVTYE